MVGRQAGRQGERREGERREGGREGRSGEAIQCECIWHMRKKHMQTSRTGSRLSQ